MPPPSGINYGEAAQRSAVALHRRSVRRTVIGPSRLALQLQQARPDRAVHEPLHDPLRGVIHAVGLASGELVDGLPAVDIRLPHFQFGDALLEDVAERVETERLPLTSLSERGGVVVGGAEKEDGERR